MPELIPESFPIPWQQPLLRVGTILTPAGLTRLRKSIPGEIAEVRVDALLKRGAKIEEIEAALRARRVPVLLTLRWPTEGGQHAWVNARERSALFLRLLPLVDAIDLEVLEITRAIKVYTAASEAKKGIILSGHAIDAAPTETLWRHWMRTFAQQPADCFKIAARIESASDLQRLAALLVTERPPSTSAFSRRRKRRYTAPWGLMGLGPQAALSRTVLMALGSKLAYGYLDEPAAPGQPSLEEIVVASKPVLALAPKPA